MRPGFANLSLKRSQLAPNLRSFTFSLRVSGWILIAF